MKKCLFTLATLLLILAFALAPASARVVRFGQVAPPWSGDIVGGLEMAKYVKEKTNGAFEIKIFPSSQLGSMISQLQQVQGGTLEMSVCASAMLQNTVPQAAVLDLPFVWPSKETAYAVLADSEFRAKLSSYMEKKGLAHCGWIQNGWRAITNSKRPIRTPEDMKGLKLRVMPSPIYLDTFKLLGVTPVPMAYAEVYQALQQKVIDGQDNAAWVSVLMKFAEVNKFMTETGHTFTTGPAIVNIDFWKSLTPAQQKIFIEGGELAWKINLEHSEKLKKDMPKSGGKSYEEICKEQGVQLIKLSDEERAVFAKAMHPIWAKYRSFIGGEFYDFFMKKIEQHNK